MDNACGLEDATCQGSLARIVQFLHPGAEHRPASNAGMMEWNTGSHRRKFLYAEGVRALTGPDLRVAPTPGVVFWGEWEAPTEYRRLDPTGERKNLPTFVHRALEQRTLVEGAQNTDPLVLGKWIYSNCKQLQLPYLRELEHESIILFGSHVDGAFVLDTCFVVASSFSYAADTDDPANQGLFGEMVLAPLAADPSAAGKQFTAYKGRWSTFGVGQPYCFVPARRAQQFSSVESAVFARPPLVPTGALAPFMSVANRQGIRGAHQWACEHHRQQVWLEVVRQVQAHGCDIANMLSAPRKPRPQLNSARARDRAPEPDRRHDRPTGGQTEVRQSDGGHDSDTDTHEWQGWVDWCEEAPTAALTLAAGWPLDDDGFSWLKTLQMGGVHPREPHIWVPWITGEQECWVCEESADTPLHALGEAKEAARYEGYYDFDTLISWLIDAAPIRNPIEPLDLYRLARYQTLRQAMNIATEMLPHPMLSSEALTSTGATLVIESAVGVIHGTRDMFDGVLEGPPVLTSLYDKHGRDARTAAQHLRDVHREILADTVRAIAPQTAGAKIPRSIMRERCLPLREPVLDYSEKF